MLKTEKRVHETSLEEKLSATTDDEEIKDLYFIQEIWLIFGSLQKGLICQQVILSIKSKVTQLYIKED